MARRRLTLLVAAVVVLAPACRSEDPALEIGEPTSSIGATATSTSTTPTTAADQGEIIRVTVASGEVSGVGDRVSVAVGAEVTIIVEADTTDHVHLHGYDLLADVAPGSPATIEFTADLAGVWEVELEDAGQLLFQLEVR
jgi:hypothetical protein